MSTLPATAAPDGVIAVSVHGSRGVVDLTVPGGATIAELAAAYAASAALTAPPDLVLASGRALAPDLTVDGVGITAGAVLVAIEPQHARPHGTGGASERRTVVAEGGGLAAACGAALALLGALAAAGTGHDVVAAVVLGVATVVGVLPFGARQAARAVCAPAFAGAACLVLAWDPLPARMPTVLGAAALAAAVTAAVARSLARPEHSIAEVLRVWIWAGLAWFALAALCVLTGASAPTVWDAGLLAAVLAARWVPTVSVDVPDHFLIDLERLAVTAWSARERPPGKRGRVVVPAGYVGSVADRGARTILASSVAILIVTAVTAPMLLVVASLPVDRVGARCMVVLGGGTLLFAAGGYRHRNARRMLRIAGSGCLVLVGVVLVHGAGQGLLAQLTMLLVALAALLVVLAVALGRGWRSAWWSRQAEVAELLCGAGSVAALVVATGLFRHLWEHHI